MTALADIKGAVDSHTFDPKRLNLLGRHPRLVLMVGHSAIKGIAAETDDHKLPREISGVPVERTDLIAGWDLVER